MSFDAKHVGGIAGGDVLLIDYTMTSSTSDSLTLIMTDVVSSLPGRKSKVEVTILEGKYLFLKGDSPFAGFVWEKSEGKESALDPKLVEPPAKDVNGNLPDDVLKKVAKLAEVGDETRAKEFYTAEYLKKQFVDKTIPMAWIENKRTGSFKDGKMVYDENLAVLKINRCYRVARSGGMYAVDAILVSKDGKWRGRPFKTYFRLIDGAWKITEPVIY